MGWVRMSEMIDVRRDDTRTTARRPGADRAGDAHVIDLTVDGPDTAAHRSQTGATKVTPPPVRDSSYYLG